MHFENIKSDFLHGWFAVYRSVLLLASEKSKLSYWNTTLVDLSSTTSSSRLVVATS